MSRNVLAISWAMPPLVVPRALQVSRLLEQSSVSGWPATVVTVDPSSLKGSVTLDADLAKLYEKRYASVAVPSSERHVLLRTLFRIAPFLKQMPDEKRPWVNPAYHQAKSLMAQQDFSALISFAQPWSSHLVGLRLHRETGLPWIAHFSDPWVVGSHSKMSWWAIRQAKRWEEQVVKAATRLVFITQETLDATMARYPIELKKKARVIPHGYDTDVLSLLKDPISSEKKSLILVHSGHFYGARSPESFLKAVSELQRDMPLEGALEVRFIGHMPPGFTASVQRLGLGSVVKSLGPRSYREALQELRDADALLLIEASGQTNLYFPSKLVDYLLFQKPILGLTPSKGLSAALLKRLHCPVAAPDDVPSIREALSHMMVQKRTGSLKISEDFSGIAQTFDIKNAAKLFATILDEVVPYDPDSTDLDRDRHLSEAVSWLKRAQDAGTDRGVSYGVRFGQDFDVSYPETTGYICQTFVELEQLTGDADLLRRAREMAEWEIAIQLPEGAVMGSKVNTSPTPAVFNTGMVLLGWAAMIRRTGEERYRQAARRAADWLLQMQEPGGEWIRGNSRFAIPGATLYNVKAAWGLAEAGVALQDDRYIQAAVKNAEFCVRQQQANGWFPKCCLTDPQHPLLHTVAYTLQGLLGIARLTGRTDFVTAVRKTADAEITVMQDGFIPGRQDARFHGTVPWSCLTGSAQMSIVWSDLFRITQEPKYREAVQAVNRYLMARHDIRNRDLRMRGGLPGSWPVWGDYGRLMILNWATKFLVDALVRESQMEKGL